MLKLEVQLKIENANSRLDLIEIHIDHSRKYHYSLVIILLGPVPQQTVKFNPRLSQISSTVFSSKNMQLEVTKYC